MANLIITKPLLALRGVLIFPGMIANLDVGREKSIAAIDAAEATDKQIILVGQKQPEQENVAADDLYEWGVLANIKQKLQLPNGAVRLLVQMPQEGVQFGEQTRLIVRRRHRLY